MVKIEAQVSLEANPNSTSRKINDVLLVKLPGSEWSNTETTQSAIVVMDSDRISDLTLKAQVIALEAKMQTMRASGTHEPVRAYPFAIRSAPDADGRVTIIERSTVQLDINDMEPDKRSNVLDLTKNTAIISEFDANIKPKADLRKTPRTVLEPRVR